MIDDFVDLKLRTSFFPKITYHPGCVNLSEGKESGPIICIMSTITTAQV